jgi:RHS repeat-associated protein
LRRDSRAQLEPGEGTPRRFNSSAIRLADQPSAYRSKISYNTLGAVDTVQYPTSSSGYRFTLKYLYSYGYVQQVKDNAAGTIFWSLSAANDYSSPLTEVLGNAATITSSYRPWTNDVLTRQVGTGGSTTNLQNLSYQWDSNGNLTQRQDLRQSLTEAFSYDTLNRLTGGTLNSVANLTVGYADNGNITNKSNAGSFDYTTQQAGCSYTGLPAQPHAVRKAGSSVYCYDKNGNMVSRGGSTISWYSYNQPNLINAGSNSTQFNYNANHQRWKQVAVDGTGTTTTWYVGGILEKLSRPGGVIEYRHMIPAGSGMAIYLRKPDGSNSTTYVTTDHLGSGDLILDSSANVLARESFTPFGARRGSNWTGTPTSADYTTFSNTTRRGFTGHEMLDAVSLVNMNGRVYDPLIGRFLSADPIVQTINFSQALNPYSYVMNMPLTLTDPSGHSWLGKLFHSIGHFLKKWGSLILSVALTFFGVPPLMVGFLSSAFSAAVNGGTFGSFLSGFVIGTIAGAIAAPIAGALSGALHVVGQGLLASVLQGALTGALAGGLSSTVMGGSFWAGFTGGALVGAVAGAMTWGAQKYLDARAARQSSGDGREKLTPTKNEKWLEKAGLGPNGEGLLADNPPPKTVNETNAEAAELSSRIDIAAEEERAAAAAGNDFEAELAAARQARAQSEMATLAGNPTPPDAFRSAPPPPAVSEPRYQASPPPEFIKPAATIPAIPVTQFAIPGGN